jgi:hypothetical protein
MERDNTLKCVPMESHANFRQEYLQVLAAQILLRHNADFLKDVATPNTGVCIDSRKRVVVVSGFEVGFFLLGKLGGDPRDDRYNYVSGRT